MPAFHKMCLTDACMADPASSAEIIGYAFRRRQCAGAFGIAAYESDLRRFASTLQAVLAERSWRARRLIWRDNTPQHYATPSGMYSTHRADTWPSAGKCVPIKEPARALATARNDVVERVLGPLFHDGGPRARLERLSTWNFDVEHHEQHPHGKHTWKIDSAAPHGAGRGVARAIDDCSHFCLHSDVTMHWLEALVSTLLKPRRKAPLQAD